MTKVEKIIVPISASISGKPKTGKSHLALTFPDPIVVFSFDIGLAPVLKKFEGKQVRVFTYPIPLIDPSGGKPVSKPIYTEFIGDYQKALEDGAVATMIIDTATNLYDLVREARREELKQDSLLQFQYGEVYARMTGILLRPPLVGKNLVLTHYLREKFVDNQGTGELELEGYRRTEGLVDIVLETRRETKPIDDGKGKRLPKNVIVTKIKDNRYDLSLNGMELIDTAYAELMSLIGG